MTDDDIPPRPWGIELAEAASLLQQAETIIDRIWQNESDRGELAPDILDLLQQTANEIEQASGTYILCPRVTEPATPERLAA